MARTSVTGAAGRRPGWGIGWLANRSISVKFLMVISVIGVVALGVGVSGILGMSRMQASSDEVYRGNLMPLTYLNTMERAALNMRIDVLNAGVSVDVQTAEKFLSKVAGDDAAFDKAVADFRGTADANGQAELAALQDAVAEYRKIRDTKLIPAVRAHDALTFGTVRDKEGAPAFNKVNAALD